MPLKEVLASGHQPVVKVGVDVKNTGVGGGNRSGADVYPQHRCQRGAAGAGVEGVCAGELAPGESKHVEFPLGFDELNFYNVEVKRTVEPTTYKIWVGGSSLATEETSLQIAE